MKQESTVDLLLDVDQRPSAGKRNSPKFPARISYVWCNHLEFPLILGMPVSVALLLPVLEHSFT